jgi:hypothetical protein
MSKYDRPSLMEFCDNNGVLLDVIPDNCNRDTRVSGSCLTENCDNCFEKNLRQLFNEGGPYCKKCTMNNRKIKCETTNLERYGVKNPFQNEYIKEKMRVTNLERYGVSNPVHNEDIKEKMRVTNLERYGVSYPSQNEDIKEKGRVTNLERYGVSYPLQNEDIKEKMRVTNLERYGVSYPSQNEDIKEKGTVTNLERYGVSNPLGNKNVQQKRDNTNLERYGSRFPMQNPDILERNHKARFRRKLYITPSGKEWYLQGYEPLVAPKIIEEYGEENITPDIKIVPRIPWFDEDGKEHYYFCDFYVDSQKLIIEVKSDYTEKLNADKIQRTRKASNELGYDFRLIVLNNDGEWVEDTTTSNPYPPYNTSSPS